MVAIRQFTLFCGAKGYGSDNQGAGVKVRTNDTRKKTNNIYIFIFKKVAAARCVGSKKYCGGSKRW